MVEPCRNIDLLNMHPKLKPRILFSSPHSHEWKEQLLYYSCGRNSGIIKLPDTLSHEQRIQRRSNLIMGCIGEAITIDNYPFDCLVLGFHKCTIEMIVKEKGVKASDGSCPDLLLVNNEEIIPVEIKTLKGKPNDTAPYLREFRLVARQLDKCAQLINLGGSQLSHRGIMILTWIFLGRR